MKERDFIFKFLDNCDSLAESIKEKLENETENIWEKYNFRKKGAQENTQCIPIYWMNHFWMDTYLNETVIIYRFIEFKRYFHFIDSIERILEKKYPNTILYQVAFTKLPANEKIHPHTDCSSKCKFPYRIHVVIKSNSDVIFYIDNIAHNFKEGEIVEINNMKIHSVSNNSNEDRIHLLVDLIDLKYFPHGVKYSDITYENITDNMDNFFGDKGSIRPNSFL